MVACWLLLKGLDVTMLGVITQTLLVFIIVCCTILFLLSRRHYAYWKKRGIPYEKPIFLIGNLSFLLRKPLWYFLLKLRKKYRNSDYFGIFLGLKPVLVIQCPQLAKKVLQKDYEHFQNRYLYCGYEEDPLGSLNLFTVKNPIWIDMRQELSPMFTTMRLKALTELMNINSEELVKKIRRDYIDNNQPVDLKELFSMYTSDTVGYSVFGLRVSALNDPTSPLWFLTRHMVRWTFWRGFEFTLIFFVPAVARLLRLKFFSKPATDYVKKIFYDVVEERRQSGKQSKRDLVEHLLKLKENLKLPVDSQLSDDLMLAQVALFILGSIETSSTTLTMCLHELAHHPDEQEKLYQEIKESMQVSGRNILQYSDLAELKYLNACILETLRKYPPLPYLDRMCNKSYKLNDEVTIEEGVPVFVSVAALHRNEKHYPEPERWKPERMMNYTDNDNLGFTFLPFGEGPRFCIGKRYGLLQVRTALAQMVAKYWFEPCPDEPYNVQFDPRSVILAPQTGGKVKMVPR